MDTSPKSAGNMRRLAGIAVVAGVLIVALAAYALSGTAQSKKLVAQVTTSPTATPRVSVTSTPVAVALSTASSDVYKDGTYKATGTYLSPGGQESLGVSLTIADDTVTAATVTNEALSGESKQYQNKFISGYKSQVIGKKLATLSLGAVSGSSLTPKGFNTAVTQIKAEAKA